MIRFIVFKLAEEEEDALFVILFKFIINRNYVRVEKKSPSIRCINNIPILNKIARMSEHMMYT